jgi:hypothetical protein
MKTRPARSFTDAGGATNIVGVHNGIAAPGAPRQRDRLANGARETRGALESDYPNSDRLEDYASDLL